MDKKSAKDMSRAEIAAQIEFLKTELQNRKSEAMNDLVNRFLSEAKENQFSVDELLAEIQKKQGLKPSKVRKKVADGVVALTGYEKDVKYVNPQNPTDTWIGGATGPKPVWLKNLFKDCTGPDEMAKKFSAIKQS